MNRPIEEALVEVENFRLSFRRGKESVEAIKGIGFSVFPGKTVAVVGESGSGKSVTAMSLLRLIPEKAIADTSGIFHFSKDLIAEQSHISPQSELLKQLRGQSVGVIFQEPMTSLNPVMTCGDQVAEVLIWHKKISAEMARLQVIKWFEEVKLPEPYRLFDKYPHEISGGQRQRVMIAMAIACEPKLLIADEPTTALDVTVQATVLDLLKQLQQKYNMGMIFITHDLGVVADIADEVVVMKSGEVVEKGPAEKVLKFPEHAYTKGLLSCRPSAEKRNLALLTVDDVMNNRQEQVRRINSISEEELLVKVDHVSKIYVSEKGWFKKERREFAAANDLNFSIRKGETLGLVGESGCGKTTLSRMMLGLIPISSGSIEVMGKKIENATAADWKELRKEMQIVFQDPYSSLNPRLTIGEAILEPMRVYGLHENESGRAKHMKDLLSRVGMNPDFHVRFPHEFSGGQRQRVVIARALSVNPSFVICDEAVAALDVSVQAQVLNLLNDLKADFGLTYLFISHDLNVVYYMSDRIMVMNKGKIEELGPAQDVFFNPQSEYTKTLLSAIPGKVH